MGTNCFQHEDTEIFVFSGTGNSLAVAEELLKELGKGKVIKITSALLSQKEIASTASKVGFIFPVYYMDLPGPVAELLQRIQLSSQAYLFAVATCNGKGGPVIKEAETILHKRKLLLNSGFIQDMPANSIFFYNSLNERNRMLSRSGEKIREVASSIKERQDIRTGRDRKRDKILRSTIRKFYEKVLKVGKKGTLKGKCTGCGICARICPMENIVMRTDENGSNIPQWKDQCASCFACLHWCPSLAVKAGLLKVKMKTIYRHPRISFSKMSSREAI